MPQLTLTILLIAVGWFFLIRPQQARIRAQRELVESLDVGDLVVTAGGIHGTITSVAEETVQIQVAPGTELTLARAAVMRRLDGGEDEDAPKRTEEAVSSHQEVADETAEDQ